MTSLQLDLEAVELPDELYDVADLIEAALERVGRRGLTPSEAGRHARVDTATAGQILQWLAARQYAHTDDRGAWSHYYRGRPQ